MANVAQDLTALIGLAGPTNLENALANAGVPNITPTPPNNIGGIDIQCTIEETYNDTLQVTEHPVEQGAAITDHSFMRPVELILRCGWSNASAAAIVNTATEFFESGELTPADYVTSVYSQLLSLQSSRGPFSVIAGLRQYSNMLITALSVTRDEKTSDALMVSASLRQVILVSTQVTQLPSQDNQKTPESTAAVQSSGAATVFPLDSAPAAGGSLPQNKWTPTIIQGIPTGN